VMKKGSDGLPGPGFIEAFLPGAANPVDLRSGPGGDLFYVDFDGGTIRRIMFTSTPPPGGCAKGQYLAEYYANRTLSGTPTFSRCETAIDYNWGSGGPGNGLGSDNFSVRWTGQFDFGAGDHTFTATSDDGIRLWVGGSLLVDKWIDQPATTYTATRTMTAGTHEVRVEYYEYGGEAVAQVSWVGGASNVAPVATITTPSAATTWKVGDTIAFSGSGSDAEDGALPASALSWSVILHHCPSTCHTHLVQTFPGVASGSFVTPDHDYPSHLELQLTVTDSGGATGTASVRLDPQTVVLSFASSPSGLRLVVGGFSTTTPFNRTVIVGSRNSLSAPSPQSLNGATYVFELWSDGGAQSHDISADSTPTTYTATYQAQLVSPANTVLPTITGQPREGRTLTANEGTWTGTTPLTYSYRWQRCDTGGRQCSDIAGATAKTYTLTSADVGSKVRVKVTATNSVGSTTATSALTSTIRREH
jgi:PA14 domain-containing protein